MTPVEFVHLAAAFILGVIAGVVLLIWAQVREVKRRRRISDVADRRPAEGPIWTRPADFVDPPL